MIRRNNCTDNTEITVKYNNNLMEGGIDDTWIIPRMGSRQ